MSYPHIQFPEHWIPCPLGHLLDQKGKSIIPASTPQASFELYSVPSFPTSTPEVLLGSEIGSNKQIVSKHSVLLCKINPRINRVWVVGDFTVHPKIASTEWIVFPKHEGIRPDFLSYFLRQHIVREFLAHNASGVGGSLMRVKPATIREFPFAIPPLAEQRRIVSKIEELFSELDKGIETLKTAKAQLAVYRQAVLKDAFEGKLTAGWRADHRDLIESSEQLLARVCAEREERYKKQLSDWKTAVQKWESGNQKDSRPCKPRSPSIVALPLKEEFAHLPELAEGWTWLRLSSCNVDVSDGPFGSNLKTSDYVGAGVRVVRLENIGVMKFIEEKESFITEEKYRLLSDHTVSPGDIVFSSFITERTRVAMVPPSIEKAVNKADCFSLRSHGSVLLNRYLCVFLSSRLVYTELESAIHGVGRPRINTTQLKELFVPVCSPSEQIAVMHEIDLQQSVLEEMESDIETNLQKAEALRQSILKKAFAGELVPQDPSDEPAAALLERIHVEREAKQNQASKKSAPKKPNARGRKPRLATI